MQVSESRIPDFLFSILKILQSPAPRGKRGSYDFARQFDTIDPAEYFLFKYALIQYFFSDEHIGRQLTTKYQKSAENELEKLISEHNGMDELLARDQIDFYRKQFTRVYGKNRLDEKTELEMELYKQIYQNIFKVQFEGWDQAKITDWLNHNEQRIQVIPQFIVWFHETFLTLLTIYDESLWAIHSSPEFVKKVTTKSKR